MARPKGMTDEDLRSPGRDEPEPAEVPDPLAGWRWDDGKPGPSSSLTMEKARKICEAIASGATKREAAAAGDTTEDCVDAWLERGRKTAAARKTSPYTRFLLVYEKAEAHYQRWARDLGHRTVLDKKTNPRFITWYLGLKDPKNFTARRESSSKQSGALGPAFEMVTPEAAAKSLEEKLRKFLGLEDQREALFASIQAEVEHASSGSPTAASDARG